LGARHKEGHRGIPREKGEGIFDMWERKKEEDEM
jgi:hypothetical protein